MSFEWCCGILFVLALIAAFGHGLWLVAAAILNALSGGSPPDRGGLEPRPFGRCPACAAEVDDHDRHCPACDLLLDGRLARDLHRVRAAEREVRGMVDRLELDPDESKPVIAALEARVRTLRGLPPKVAPRPRAAPVSPAPVVAEVAPEPVDSVPTPVVAALAAVEPPVAVDALSSDTDATPPVVAAVEPPAPLPPPKPRASFLEEHNILWGELVGGLLIVGCSVALLVTLWRQLEEIRYFPFALSAGVTLALFGAGQYTLHRWKLAGTSRGMLIIALLLVPLTLLLLSEPVAHGTGDALDIGVKVLAVAALVGVVRTGGRDLIGTSELPGPVDRRWLLSLAVVGAAGTQLLPAALSGAWLPLGCFVVALGATLGGLSWYHPGRRDEPIPDASGTALLTFAGLSVFALFAAWGLYLVRPPVEIAARLHALAIPLALAAIPVIETGVLVLRRTTSAGLRTTGTAVALLGFLGVTAALTLAWPSPLALLAVSAAAGAHLTRVAFRERLPWAQTGAVPLLAFAAVIGVHALNGSPDATDAAAWLAARLDSPESGAALVGFALLLAVAAEALARRVPGQSFAYGVGALAVGGFGLVLVGLHGIEQPAIAAGAHAAAAVGMLLANLRHRRRGLAQGGLLLALAGSLWGLWAGVPRAWDVWGFAVAAEGLWLAGVAVGTRRVRHQALAPFRRAARDVSFAAGALAIVLALSSRALESDWHSYALFALTLTAAALARLTGQPGLTWAASVAALLGVSHFALYTLDGSPRVVALEAAVLTHATLAGLVAVSLRRQVRVFANPLRHAARLSAVLAIPLLFVAPPGYAFVAAALAVWLGLVWLALVLRWREVGAFSAFLAAVSLAAVLAAFGWVEQQPWWGTTALGLRDPRALHAFGLALAALAVVWALARRALAPVPRVRELWADDPLSLERWVLGGMVVGTLVLAAVAVAPAAGAELTQLGYSPPAAPAELVYAFDAPAWWLLALLTTALVVSWRLSRLESDAGPHVVGLALLLLAAPVVWAGGHADDTAAASALRWGLAAAFVGGTLAVSLRLPLRRALAAGGFPAQPTPWLRPTLLALFAGAAGVVLILSAQVAQLGLNRLAPSGPAEGSAFALMGAVPSNLTPLALVVFGLALTAARERSSGYALSGGLVFVVTLVAGRALAVVVAGGAIDAAELTRLHLITAAGAAAWALTWLASEHRVPGGAPLAVQVALAFVALGWLCFVIGLGVVVFPDLPLTAAVDPLGRPGWATLTLVAGAGFWHTRRHAAGLQPLVFGYAALVVGVLVAVGVREFDAPELWRSFHALAVTWAALGLALIALPRSRAADVVLSAFAGLLVVCALRGGWSDPLRPWPSVGLSLAGAVLFGAVAVRRELNAFALLSGAAVNLAAVLTCVALGPDTTAGFLLANAAGIGAAAGCWSLVRIRVGARGWLDALDPAPPVALVLLALGLMPTFAADGASPTTLNWLATVAVVAGCGVGLWDRAARLARPCVYAAVALAVLLAASERDPRPVWDAPVVPLALAGYALVACGAAYALAQRRAPILGIPERGSWTWLVPATVVVGVFALAFGLRVGLTSPAMLERIVLPVSVAALALAPSVLQRFSSDALREPLQTASAALGVAIFAALAWSVPEPDLPAVWLERNAWLFVALAVAAIGGSEGAATVGADWLSARKRVAGVAAALALVVLVVNLLQQVPVFDPKERCTPLSRAASLSMLAAIGGLFVLALRFALKPDRDPLALPPHRRTAYVYLSEVLIVLFFTQIRLNVPELFFGPLAKLWTFIVMALAYAGIGLAELFERRRLDVLAVPLRRTGVLLPLVPLIAFWAKPPQFVTEFAEKSAPGLGPFLGYLQNLPQHFDTYAWLWFLAGGVYGVLALKRRSFGWALLAALATNFAMWSLLQYHQVPFAVHPQVWVIPLALIVLASEHVNRARLTAEASNALRYAGIAMIYVASAADLFIAGIGQSVWLPVVLAVLCVAGVVAGIGLRVRAFVHLGVAFLLLDVFAMIWHAAVNLRQTWVWYASGIVLGVFVLALFAYLEKRRTQDEPKD